jgi:hypothetical protein
VALDLSLGIHSSVYLLSGSKLSTSKKHEYEQDRETKTGQGNQDDTSDVQNWDDFFLTIRIAHHGRHRSIPDEATIGFWKPKLKSLRADVYLATWDCYRRGSKGFDTK